MDAQNINPTVLPAEVPPQTCSTNGSASIGATSSEANPAASISRAAMLLPCRSACAASFHFSQLPFSWIASKACL